MTKSLIAVAQVTSRPTPSETLPHILPLLAQVSARNASILFLPEAADYISPTPKAAASVHAHPLDKGKNPFLDSLRAGAKEHKLWINVGLHERSTDPSRCWNTSVVLDTEGKIRGVYRKVHLFDVDLQDRGGPKILESSTTVPGEVIVDPVQTPAGLVGLQICYDLRFPTPPTLLYPRPHILTYPSAFALSTGPVHWSLLLRARAVEQQCYVVASAQVGEHFSGRASWGQTLVASPWGEILGELPSTSPTNRVPEAELLFVEIDTSAVDKVRQEMPLEASRRRAESTYEEARKRRLGKVEEERSGVDTLEEREGEQVGSI
ncbi:carbon-nitrogen hydrolase [Dacryopinax primogenitus]|uniref:Carbon-nitrogen hydrolase n=1 Tax=Dacryopinax primogenitus (strain DJM 731) TaxID=1858805 RepID=M5GC17_DACPD|nr:carbon-nitrogen hydrolase [Dacryopinax primogenitus]EJU01573.1 carbon-nitrogen hydrolase [Dacryopinax primogenitus]